jgi:hypothetical protein
MGKLLLTTIYNSVIRHRPTTCDEHYVSCKQTLMCSHFIVQWESLLRYDFETEMEFLSFDENTIGNVIGILKKP